MKFFLFLFSFNLMAQETQSFRVLLEKMNRESFGQKSAGAEVKAQELALERANRHWLPRLSLGVSQFQTNDPTSIFFNHLGQRSIEQADFMLDNLNEPESETFQVARVMLTVPLYEGGMKSNQVSLFKSMLKSTEVEKKARVHQDYADLTLKYANLILSRAIQDSYDELDQSLNKIIKNYQVGESSNPVGHSGLLGLQGVQKRIQGLKSIVALESTSSMDWIEEKTQTKVGELEEVDLVSFREKYLRPQKELERSSMLLAQQLKVEGLNYMTEMEKARFLPQVSLFSNLQFYGADRSNEQAQTVGIQLVWDIFNNDSYGRLSEAKAKKRIADYKIQEHQRSEKIMRQKLKRSKLTLEANSELLNESNIILDKQTKNAMKLFRKGMITALQLAEVINRRVDLIDQRYELETKLTEVYQGQYLVNN